MPRLEPRAEGSPGERAGPGASPSGMCPFTDHVTHPGATPVKLIPTCAKKMNRLRFATRSLLAAGVLSVVCSAGQAHAFRIYTLSSLTTGGSTSTRFGYVETNTGIYKSIKAPVGPAIYRNLVWNSRNFYTTRNNTPNGEFGTLSLTGDFTLIGSAAPNNIDQQIYGMTYGNAQNLYSYDYTNNALGTINTSNGTFNNPVSSGFTVTGPQGGRLTNVDGVMYGIFRTSPTAANDAQLRRITVNSPTSVTYTTLSSGTNTLYRNMVLASYQGSLYGVFGNGGTGSQALYKINLTTGAPTLWKTITNAPGTLVGQQVGTFFHGASNVPGPLPILATSVILGSVRKMKNLSRRLSGLKQTA
jgi:hypothetical protein